MQVMLQHVICQMDYSHFLLLNVIQAISCEIYILGLKSPLDAALVRDSGKACYSMSFIKAINGTASIAQITLSSKSDKPDTQDNGTASKINCYNLA